MYRPLTAVLQILCILQSFPVGTFCQEIFDTFIPERQESDFLQDLHAKTCNMLLGGINIQHIHGDIIYYACDLGNLI